MPHPARRLAALALVLAVLAGAAVPAVPARAAVDPASTDAGALRAAFRIGKKVVPWILVIVDEVLDLAQGAPPPPPEPVESPIDDPDFEP
jgi:hypothetical protein